MRNWVLSLALCLASALLPAMGQETPSSQQLTPAYRHTIVVSDLERSLTLYRDVLGLTLDRVNDLSDESYSATFFNVPAGTPKRFAYLNGRDGRKNILGLAEVPSITLPANDGVRPTAWVQTVDDPERVMAQVKALGLTVIPPTSFTSRVTGSEGMEAGVIDFDGHLVMFYGLKQVQKP